MRFAAPEIRRAGNAANAGPHPRRTRGESRRWRKRGAFSAARRNVRERGADAGDGGVRGGSRYRVIWPRIRAGWRRKGSSRLPCRSGHHIAMDSILHRFVLAEIAPAVHGGWRWARTAYEEIEPVCQRCLAGPSIKLGWAALWTTTLSAMP